MPAGASVLLTGMALVDVPAIWQMGIRGVVSVAALALYGMVLYGMARSRGTYEARNI